jgi:error-prone DNA polymerase
MLNSQPLGFYAPAQLVRDARAHGVEVRPVDVLVSQAQCALEEFDEPHSQPAVRLGLAQVRSLSAVAIERILAAREQRLNDSARSGGFAFDDVDDLAQCAQLDATALRALADSGALLALAGHRRQACWAAAAGRLTGGFLDQTRIDEAPIMLTAPSEGEDTIADYRSLGIPMGRHPLALLRAQLDRLRIEPASTLAGYPDGRIARASGLVTHRQRPETARGTLFVTLEDDTGTVNVIVWPAVFERFRAALLGAQLMSVYGYWQRQEHGGGTVTHLVAARIIDHTALLGALESRSRNFR